MNTNRTATFKRGPWMPRRRLQQGGLWDKRFTVLPVAWPKIGERDLGCETKNRLARGADRVGEARKSGGRPGPRAWNLEVKPNVARHEQVGVVRRVVSAFYINVT